MPTTRFMYFPVENDQKIPTSFNLRLPWHPYRLTLMYSKDKSPKRQFSFFISLGLPPYRNAVDKVHFAFSYGTWLHIVIMLYYMCSPLR